MVLQPLCPPAQLLVLTRQRCLTVIGKEMRVTEFIYSCAILVHVPMAWISLGNILLAPVAEEFVDDASPYRPSYHVNFVDVHTCRRTERVVNTFSTNSFRGFEGMVFKNHPHVTRHSSRRVGRVFFLLILTDVSTSSFVTLLLYVALQSQRCTLSSWSQKNLLRNVHVSEPCRLRKKKKMHLNTMKTCLTTPDHHDSKQYTWSRDVHNLLTLNAQERQQTCL